jgi:ribosome biogenesis protein Tsr3
MINDKISCASIRNINEKYGDPVLFDSIETMLACLISCGYADKTTVLTESVDYEVVK